MLLTSASLPRSIADRTNTKEYMSNLTLPGNPRYQPKSLQPIFGYDNLMRPIGEIEIATLRTLAEIEIVPEEETALLTPEKESQILAIPTTQVDDVERRITQHDIRAWVMIAQEIVGPKLGKWIHVPLTSYDVIDTGRSLQFSRAHTEVIRPAIKEAVELFAENIRCSAKALMIGRTHGQHALPITVGFWLATILARILYNFGMLDFLQRELVGKISGAVGAKNAQFGLGIEQCAQEKKGKSFEKLVLERLGFRPALISTQILPPEPLAYYLNAVLLLSGALAQFGRDGRHLMRSEIEELSEPFEQGQVGSSTMAHKRNPINLEKLEGLFIKNQGEYAKVVATLISEHQRDLTGSSVSRDFPTLVVNLVEQLNTLLRKNKAGVSFLARLKLNEEACQRNFAQNARLILAEPLYIALQMAGYREDAHHLLNHTAVPMAQAEHILLIEAVERIAQKDTDVSDALGRIPLEIYALFRAPERYSGDAEASALRIVEWAEARLKESPTTPYTG